MISSCNNQDKKSPKSLAPPVTECDASSIDMNSENNCTDSSATQADASSQASPTTSPPSSAKSPKSLEQQSAPKASAKSEGEDQPLAAPGNSPKQDEGQSLIITADPRFPKPFQTFPLNEIGHNFIRAKDVGQLQSSMFSCPGDSFLVGQYAV